MLPAMEVNQTFLKNLRTLGTIEGVSTLILFGVAMPLKYFAGIPIAVTIAGMIHGLLFTALAAMFVLGIKRIPIPQSLAAAGVAAAIVPFGPFFMDGRLRRIANSNLSGTLARR
jgi:integral membrane protein